MTQKNQISDGQLAPSESSWWLRELLEYDAAANQSSCQLRCGSLGAYLAQEIIFYFPKNHYRN
jgi:hypothetical protein